MRYKLIKSLYIRVAVTFVCVVAVSFLIAFFVTSTFYQNRFQEAIKAEIFEIKKAIEVQLPSTSFALIKENTELIYHYQIDFIEEGGSSDKVPPEDLDEVFSGNEVYYLKPGPDMYIGIPMTIEGKKGALILEKKEFKFTLMFHNSLFTITWIAILIGIIISPIITRSIVSPIKQLTRATKRLAQGDFTTIKRTNRKDEIGQLTESFNEMAAELRLLVKMREDFVSNVSHEFQTPLTSIIGFTKALQNKPFTEEQRMHYLSIIESESERLAHLSRDILRLSHIQQGQYRLSVSWFSLDEQIRNIVISQEPQWSAKDLKVTLDMERAYIKADEYLLQQVWINLINNAIKFSPDEGEVNISLKVKSYTPKIEVLIQNYGSEIPTEEHKHIFTPFYKVDKGRDTKVSGNGLGLTICQQIIQLHQGSINVESGNEKGTTFAVMLSINYEGQDKQKLE